VARLKLKDGVGSGQGPTALDEVFRQGIQSVISVEVV
jgi:hypothetical protein